MLYWNSVQFAKSRYCCQSKYKHLFLWKTRELLFKTRVTSNEYKKTM